MIKIVPYDMGWVDEFGAIVRAMEAVLGESALSIDHIGSTSVPGLAAKDIIDVQITVEDFTNVADLMEGLGSLGYVFVPENDRDHVPPLYEGDELDWEKRYFRSSGDLRPTHVHVRAVGRANQRYALLFRDYLRAHPVAREAYGQIKLALARRCPDDKGFYYEVKDPLCDIVMEAAEEWVGRKGRDAAR